MKFPKFLKVFKPVGSHKRIVKLMEIKQSLSIVTVLIFVLAEITLVGYLMNRFISSDTISTDKEKNIAILNIDEAITSKYVERLISRLEPIRKNPNIFPELLVVMNCPGGSPSASDEMRYYLEDLQKEGVNITMYVESMAASGGYYIATASKYEDNNSLSGIIANQNALVGSIGVILSYPVIEEAAKKLGVTQKSITMGKYKQPISPFKNPSQEDEDYIKRQYMNPIYENFKKMVALGRDMSLEELEPYAEGRVFIANKVVGPLVDRISYMYKIKTELKEKLEASYVESSVGFVKINTKKAKDSLFDTKFDINVNSELFDKQSISMQ